MMSLWAGKIARLWSVGFVFSFAADAVTFLFNRHAGRVFGGWLGFMWFWLSVGVLSILLVWYVCAYAIGLIRWRIDRR